MVNVFFKNISAIALVSICAISCNQSGKEEKSVVNTDTSAALVSPVTGSDSASTAVKTGSGGLQDVWVLDSANGKPLSKIKFDNGTPYLETNLSKKTISGFTGCGGFKGILIADAEKFSVDSLNVDKVPCKNTSFHNSLVSSLKKANLPYEIKNGNLHINGGKGVTYIFRPIRR